MDTLHRELEELVAEVAPPLIDMAWLDSSAHVDDTERFERLVTDDELHVLDGDCDLHDGCRSIVDRWRP